MDTTKDTERSNDIVQVNPRVALEPRDRNEAWQLAKVAVESGFFAVNVLSARQLEIGMRFAGMKPEIKDRFAGLKTHTAVTGSPLLPDSDRKSVV